MAVCRRLMARFALCAVFALAAALVDGCRRKAAQQVVLYVSADDHLARSVIAEFEKQTGISVLLVGDTEAKKTSGLAERLRAERNAPAADVFWSSEIIQTIALADEGVFDEHLSTSTTDWPRTWRDGQRRWFAFAARPRVIAFAPNRVPESERPRTWMDLTRPQYKGRLAMADPRFGTTGTHLAVMLWHWDRTVMPGYFRAWAEGIVANNTLVSANGNAGVVEAIASGEADLGLTDADDVWAAQARGVDIDLIYPLHDLPERGEENVGGGTLLIPNTVARVKGGPNPANAKVLIDFLLSEEVERMLAESVSHNVPMRDSLQEEFPQFVVPAPLEVDWAKGSALREKALKQFFEAIRSVKEEREAAAMPGREPEPQTSSPEPHEGDPDDES